MVIYILFVLYGSLANTGVSDTHSGINVTVDKPVVLNSSRNVGGRSCNVGHCACISKTGLRFLPCDIVCVCVFFVTFLRSWCILKQWQVVFKTTQQHDYKTCYRGISAIAIIYNWISSIMSALMFLSISTTHLILWLVELT